MTAIAVATAPLTAAASDPVATMPGCPPGALSVYGGACLDFGALGDVELAEGVKIRDLGPDLAKLALGALLKKLPQGRILKEIYDGGIVLTDVIKGLQQTAETQRRLDDIQQGLIKLGGVMADDNAKMLAKLEAIETQNAANAEALKSAHATIMATHQTIGTLRQEVANKPTISADEVKKILNKALKHPATPAVPVKGIKRAPTASPPDTAVTESLREMAARIPAGGHAADR